MKKYRNAPKKIARTPFVGPRSCGIKPDSCIHERMANIIPKEDRKSHINFFMNALWILFH